MKFFILFFIIVSCSTLNAKNIPLKTVEYVEIERYLGTWYEIARFEHRFQKGCTATTAEYSLREDGDIKVINSCHINSPNGDLKSAEARGWVKDKKSNAKLKVQFFLKKLKLGLFAGDYWIIDLGENYEYAMIGEPSRKYLWILSRDPYMDEETYSKLISKAESLNFDTSKLIKTEH